MDTYGGEVDAAFNIVDTLINTGEKETIAYVKTKAISAGALIALSCDKMVMKKSTTIGDVAPLMMSNEGPKMLGEKYQSPIRAKFRTLAKRNGYQPVLTDAMVTEGLIVYRLTFPDTVMYLDSTGLAELSSEYDALVIEKKTVVKKNQLLTMDDSEAFEFGFSKGSVESFDQLLSVLKITDAEVIRCSRSWSETLVAFIAKIAPILMMIGFAALYIEIRTPGFGVPGMIGIICLAVVFLSQYMVGLADYTELLLLTIGIVLLAIEVFVLPGFGIAGICGILFLFAAMVLSLQGFVLPRPEFPWEKQTLIRNLTYASGSLVGAIVMIVLFFRYIFPKIGMMINGPYLHATLKDAHADTNTGRGIHIGDCGVCTTPLRPSGKAEINGVLHDVVAESMFISSGKPVTVIEVSGNRIVVTGRQDNDQ
jgi:membrane-bound serine protease (ClpP class)